MLLAGIAAVTSASPAAAVESASPAPAISGSIVAGATSDYVFRGVSLTGEKPTGFLYGEAAAGVFYANALLIGNELGVDALGRSIGNLEADVTAGIAPTLGKITFNLGGKFTGYPNGRDIVVGTMTHAERDFIEFFGGAKIDIVDGVSVGATGYFIPDFYYQTGRVRTLELQGAFALPTILTAQSRLTSAVGFVRSDAVDIVSPGHGYVYYNAGIEGQIERLVFDLRYSTTDVHGLDAFEQRLSLMVGVKFP